MSDTPEVDPTIAINKHEEDESRHAGNVAKARWEAGFRKTEHEDNAERIYRGELDREGAIVERQQTNKIERRERER